jgi:hypothetical protein
MRPVYYLTKSPKALLTIIMSRLSISDRKAFFLRIIYELQPNQGCVESSGAADEFLAISDGLVASHPQKKNGDGISSRIELVAALV